MPPPLDRTGQTFGMLTVVCKAPSYKNHTYWNCKCECGKTVIIAGSNLKNQKSCGCLKEDYLSPRTFFSIRWKTHGYCLPIHYTRKSQVDFKDREEWPHGYWLCICSLCSIFFRATTKGLRTNIADQKVRSCPDCAAKARDLWFEGLLKEERSNLKPLVQREWARQRLRAAKGRCADLTHPRYGGRGIHVCERWLQPDDVGLDNLIADLGLPQHQGLSLERRNSHGHYCPENCKWDTDSNQARNKSTSVKFLILGEQVNQVDLAELLGTNSKALSRRVARMRKDGMTQEQIDERLSDQVQAAYGSPTHNVRQTRMDTGDFT